MRIIRIAVNNPVAVNIVMFAIVFFGLYKVLTITREFFPPADFDRIAIVTAFPGATPEEVEKGITTRVENAVESIAEIEEITSLAMENRSLVILKIKQKADLIRVAEEVRTEIDRIQDLPEEAEKSFVEVLEQTIPVISVVVFGEASERKLKRVAEEIKDELLASPLVSQAVVSGTRNEELSIEVRPDVLEAYGLTLEEVGLAVRGNNLDVAGGEIKSPRGNILVRTLGQEDTGLPLESMIVRASEDGRAIRLADIADVKDTFEETALRGTFQGKRAVQVTIFKKGDEDAVRISRFVKDYMREKQAQFAGENLRLEYRVDLARFIAERIALLSKNAMQGLVLVFIALALFLNLRLAFWVGAGLVICFLGTFIVMDWMGATINLISLFGLIIVIGLIVDDAIIVSENIFAKLEEGLPPHVAAVEGAEEVAGPVLVTVLTTIAAFAPLAFAQGVVGDFFVVLPMVVIAALALSLAECLTILPSHLAEFGRVPTKQDIVARQPGLIGGFRAAGARLAALKADLFGERLTSAYVRLLERVLVWRYVTLATALFIAMLTIGLMSAGYLPFVLFQRVDADTLVAELEMTPGTQAEETEAVLLEIGEKAMDFPGVKSVYSVVGFREEDPVPYLEDPAIVGEVILELAEANERELTSIEITNMWRERVGNVPGAAKLRFRDRAGGPPGAEIEIRVSGPSVEVVEEAVRYIRERMGRYTGVIDIEDNGGTGKLELRVRMHDHARTLGLSQADVARQVRSAFFGFEAQVLQRDREEVKVWVRLDEESRRSMVELLQLRIATPAGDRVPLGEVADIQLTRGMSSITRVDGLRTVTITADVDFALANTNEVTASLDQELANISHKYPGVRISFEGAKKETAESIGSLAYGFPVALLLIYCMLAILFRNYLQPLLVMTVIPFALVGASLGHLLFGLIPGRSMMPVTFLSLIGMVGLSGIVVNDSLIFMDFINQYRLKHPGRLYTAVVQAGRRRFRPIVLTSITTVLGLFPLMLETSFQAQFLIPMAISISFGLALATTITLLLLPCLYMIFEDLRTITHWLVTGRWEVVRLQDTELLAHEEQAHT